MRSFPFLLALGAASALASCSDGGSAPAPDAVDTTAAAQLEAAPTPLNRGRPKIEELRFVRCPEDDGGFCRGSQAQLKRNWPEALRGDYQGQRNVAYTFSTGDIAVQRPVQGCAWRMIIMASASPELDDTDMNNFQLYCGRLSADNLQEALLVADQISERVYGTELGEVPALPKTRG